MTFMLIIYRILSFFVNGLFLIAVIISFAEPFIEGYLFNLKDFSISMLVLYAAVTSLYFVLKTKYIYTIKKDNTTEALDSTLLENNSFERFRFDLYVGISNIVLALIWLGACIYVLYYFPIQVFHPEEIARFSVILFVMSYATLQIFYSLRIIQILQTYSRAK